MEGCYGLVEMSGIKLIGSFDTVELREGLRVKMVTCGVRPEYTLTNNPLGCIHMSYDRFVDERLLTSRDALNKLQIKMKVVQIDENARDFSQRFGHRVLVQKVLLTIKYNDTEEVEEKELDVEEIEKRIKKERLFSSSNRWLASSDIKNGYVVASHHLDLLADAIALDIISV